MGVIMTIELHPRVLELMASRICHDLVSPVGAINNGVELLAEMGADAGEEAMLLIASSAMQASIRLKCFRLAYGAAGTDRNIGITEVRDAFIDWLKAGHIQAEFEPNLGARFSMPPRGFFKCLLNVMILAEECSRGEGKIFISALEDNTGIKVLATGHHVGFRDGGEAALKGDTSPDDLDPRMVHAYLTGKFAEFFGLKISHQAQPDFGRLEFQISF
jgi:histidine phosphotransferase ChpT